MSDLRNLHDDAEGMPAKLAASLRRLGLGVPETEAEVAAAEAWLRMHPVEVPQSLLDPQAILRGPKRPRLLSRVETDMVGETLENLARAAREGGAISEEIEERMKQDREKAKRERGDS